MRTFPAWIEAFVKPGKRRKEEQERVLREEREEEKARTFLERYGTRSGSAKDAEALMRDWEQVGRDMRTALKRFEEEDRR